MTAFSSPLAARDVGSGAVSPIRASWRCSRAAASRRSRRRQANSHSRTVRLCDLCQLDWTPSGRALVARFDSRETGSVTGTVVVLLEPGSAFPPLPTPEIRTSSDLSSLPSAKRLDGWVYPDESGLTSIFVRTTTERNIYRVPVP